MGWILSTVCLSVCLAIRLTISLRLLYAFMPLLPLDLVVLVLSCCELCFWLAAAAAAAAAACFFPPFLDSCLESVTIL